MQKLTLKKRDLYLDRMIAFQDTEMIKVITGIRRCGKSSLMKLMAHGGHRSICVKTALPRIRYWK